MKHLFFSIASAALMCALSILAAPSVSSASLPVPEVTSPTSDVSLAYAMTVPAVRDHAVERSIRVIRVIYVTNPKSCEVRVPDSAGRLHAIGVNDPEPVPWRCPMN